MAIKWARLSLSWKRGIEVFSAFFFIMTMLTLEVICISVFAGIFLYGGTVGKALCVIYLVFMYFDRKADEDCSRGQGYEFMRSFFLWKHFVDYFPSKLVKTVDIPPNKNYIFVCFPHGVISCGAFGHFVTSRSNFRELFPGIRSKLCTLSFHFFVPIFREIGLGWGLMSVKSSSIKRALSQPTDRNAKCNADGYTSNGVVLMVGGAQEALNARPGVYKIVLRKRKGFAKCAIQTGASLVPVFSFNEVEVFDQPSNEPGTKLRKFQDIVKKLTGVAPACFIGRGFFQYSFGIIPRRHPIQTVVGAPIHTVKNESPSNEEIEALHDKFIVALTKLFDDHKQKYLKNADKVKLIIE